MKLRFERLFGRGNAPSWLNRWVLLAVLALTATVATGSGLLWGLPTAQSQTTPPEVTLSTSQSSYSESVGTVSVQVTLSVTPTAGDVEVTLTGSGLANNEYSLSTTTVTFSESTTALMQPVTLTLVDDNLEEGGASASRDLTITPSITDGDATAGSPLVLMIMDDDTPMITIVPSATAFKEGGQGQTLSYTLSKSPADDLVVTTTGGFNGPEVFIPGPITDFTQNSAPRTRSRNAGARLDTRNEDDEIVTFSFALARGNSRAVLVTQSVQVTVLDAPHVTVSAVGGTSFAEDVGTITLEVVADTAPAGADLVVTLTPSSTDGLVEGTDYELSAGSVTFADGAPNADLTETVTLTLTGIDNDVEESARNLSIALSRSPTNRGTVGSALNLMITDDDAPVVTITPGRNNLNEGEATMLTFTADKTPINDLTINITGDNPNDYNLSATSVILRAGQLTETVDFTTVTDSIDEPTENVMLSFTLVSGGSGASLAAGSGSGTIGIFDAPHVTVSAVGGASFTENDGANNREITLNVVADAAPSGGNLVVSLAGTGLAADEFSFSQPSVTFTPGGGSAQMHTVTLTLVNDDIEEAAMRTLTITPTLAPATRGSADALDLTIVDDDTPVITIQSDTDTVIEGEVATLTFSVSRSPSANVTLTLSVPSQFSSDASLSNNGIVTFTPSSAASSTQTLMFMALDDNLDELDEAVGLAISRSGSGTGAMVAVGTIVEVTVVDTDVPQLSFSPSTLSLNEGGSYETFTVISNIAVAADVVVDVAVSSGDASQFAINPMSATIPAGMMASGPVVLAATDDGDAEVEATVGLSLSVTGGDAQVPASALVVTVNDDDTPRVTVTAIGGTTFSENDGVNDRVIMLNVGLSNAPAGGNVVVTLTPSGLGAGDSLPTAMRTVTFTATSALDQQVTLTLNNDDVEELTRRLDVAYAVTTTGMATANAVDSPLVLMITDDDAPNITFTLENGDSLAEGEMKTITFTTSKSPIDGLTINVGGGDTADSSVSPDSVTFVAGSAAGSTRTVVFTATPDSDNENTETVNLNFSLVRGTSGASLGGGGALMSSQPIRITDAPHVTVSAVGGTSFSENDGTNNRVITLNVVADAAPVGGNLVVSLAGTGLAADEFSLSQPSVTFTPGGALTQTVTLTLVNDNLEEAAMRTLTITPTLAPATRGSADAFDLTVNDDDTPNITFTLENGDRLDEGEMKRITFTTSKAPRDALTINITSNNSTDASFSPSSVTFAAGTAAGSTQVVTFTATPDDINENLETVNLNFNLVRGNSGASLVNGFLMFSQAIGIRDAPHVTVTSPDGARFDENDGENNREITLNVVADVAPVVGDLVVSLVGSGLAFAEFSSDEFSFSPSSVTFRPGDSGGALTKMVTLTLVNDELEEEKERNLRIWPSLNPTTGASRGATLFLTIVDDDDPVIEFEVGRTTLAEGEQTTLTFTASKRPRSTVEVDISLDNIVDSSVSRTTVTFATATTALSEMVTFRATPDSTREDDETVTLTFDLVLGNSRTGFENFETDYATFVTGTGSLMVKITDAPHVTVSTVGTTFTENDGERNREIRLSVAATAAPISNLVVTLTPTSLDGLVEGTDYRLSEPTVTFLPTDAGSALTKRVTLTLLNDELEEEPTRALRIGLSVNNNELGTVGSALVSEVLDDDVPEVEVTINPPLAELREGERAVVTFRVTKIPRNPVRITITGANDDGSVSDTEVILDEDQLSQRIIFTAVSDLDDEREEEVVALMFALDAGPSSRAARVVNEAGEVITESAPLVFNIVNVPPPVGGGRIRLPGTGDGGVLGLWGVAGLALSGVLLIGAGAGVAVVRRRAVSVRS